LGEPQVVTLQPGTKIDRYGYEGGSFVAPEGTPYEMRSLAPGTETKPYNVYEVECYDKTAVEKYPHMK